MNPYIATILVAIIIMVDLIFLGGVLPFLLNTDSTILVMLAMPVSVIAALGNVFAFRKIFNMTSKG